MKLTSIYLSLSLVGLLVPANAESWTDHYTIENIPSPVEVDPQYGGVTALSDGRIAACFYSGEVEIYHPETKSWSLFAEGLQCPLGILEDKDGSILVMQWSELTRLKDTDSDGSADHYETVFNKFGVSGNYHEFAYGPARDMEGNLYISLNVASNNGDIFSDVRGPFTPIGIPREMLDRLNEEEVKKKFKAKAGRMFSRVAYRGCVLKITPDGVGTTFAYGFRSPDGIGVDDEGRLWVTDNQGDWRGTSPLYHVTEGNFYGHPASLVWKDGWTRNPLDVPVPELEKLRTRAAGLFPHGELANSPTQPIPTIDPSLFGLPKGELLIGDMNQPTLIRFLPDEVNDTVQGTAIPFIFSTGLGIGNHRFTFGKDGSLWIGKTHVAWAGDEGMRRISWNRKPMFIADKVKLLEDGFEIHFNNPLGETPPEISVSRHTYEYHAAYGSPKVDLKDVDVAGMSISGDRKTLRLKLPGIDTQRLYTIQLKNAADSEGRTLMGDILRYNVVTPVGAKAESKDSAFEDMLAPGDLSLFHDNAKNEHRWSLENGVVSRGVEKTGSLLTKNQYKNFELRFDWKISRGGNSGVIYRSQKGRGLEYQVLDDEEHIRGKVPHSSAAALYDLVAPMENKPYKPAGEWNSGRIVADGNHIEHWLNDVKVLEINIRDEEWNKVFKESKYKEIENFADVSSAIQFQDHGADVSFRNVQIRKLD